MSVVIYNTLSRQKEAFKPLSPEQVTMYCCGVTVYDYCHLGHARSYIVWDTIRRYLSWRGYNVRYVQNFTDIDDKILNRARQENSSMEAVAKEYTTAYFEDMARLNILEADEYTYATHTIDGIKRLIHQLEQKGYAYSAKGDVYYSVRKFEGYGKLSGRKLDDMEAGRSGRVGTQADSIKQDPFDFALWKSAKPDEPAWESTWGPGRPGWHIECSAMVRDRLGDTIDIHMGGADLQFPHHENEIAQSEAATGKPLATYWMHNGMVNVDGTKMSKSLGNFTTIRNLLDAEAAPDPMAVRMFVMQSQYRMPLDFTEEAIVAAKKGWSTLNEGLNFGVRHGEDLGWAKAAADEIAVDALDQAAVEQFRISMDDDFNTPGAIAVLFGLAKELQRQSNVIIHEGAADANPAELQQQWQTLVTLAGVLGLEAQAIESVDAGVLSEAEIETLIAQRANAKQAKNYAESDRIRDELKAQGITLIDKPGGVTAWHS
ncbi:cysteinyl-tRNA synthetase [Synechococcus sp. PCC 7335]|uniref:cysteine--tRNA ligase n=1 Tax=Synechococcus sp. (strain ATCC 29403 / PCC 7335) TaxID=91464 RepID=UPI00017EB179|nr:cysteine--tRNA ligase [Synechococcus sp. PCC 7335]EDX84636.1 cysteinyl-tRNA synthetase [Synechococcus sp. PCC 7335]